jgi:crossover junction endodeoxyribonuclease RuvC
MTEKAAAYVGIDPGLTGALALYAPQVHVPFAGSQPMVEVFDTPLIEVNGKRTINLWSLSKMLSTWSDIWDIKQVVVERVNAMPGQGVTSVFSFGFSAGSAQQAVASAGLPLTLVHPATWKAQYGLRGGRENKDASRAKASQLLPTFANMWARKKDDGRAEAVLLAHYGSRLQ